MPPPGLDVGRSSWPTNTIRYVLGQRGQPKLVCDGYSFVRDKGNASATYWRCSAMRTRRCPARIVTHTHHRNVCLKRVQHTHDPDYDQFAAAAADAHRN